MKSVKTFSLAWIFEPIQENPSFETKKMFGCLAGYLDGRMVIVLAETSGDRVWKKKRYSFDLWSGLLFPTEREHQASLLKDFPEMVPHPVLPKWLYLPKSVSGFDSIAVRAMRRIEKRDERFGIVPKKKKKKKSSRGSGKG